MTFRVAVTRDYDDDAEARWYGVSVGKERLANACLKQLKKGSRVVIEGVPSTKEADNGTTFYNFKAFRVGLVDYIGMGRDEPAPKKAAADDDDWGDDL